MTTRDHNRYWSSDFTLEESKYLANMILQRISIIESKETSAIMWMRKEAAWEEITEAFNSLTKRNRTVETLKTEYAAIKINMKSAKKRKSYLSWQEGLLKFIEFGLNPDYGNEQYPSSEDSTEYDCDEESRREY